MKTDIIFTRTRLPLEEEYAHLAKLGSIEMPNGLCYLAAATRKAGYKTEIIDAHAMNLSNNKLTNVIINKNPKYVGISANTININKYIYSCRLGKESKKLKPTNNDDSWWASYNSCSSGDS